SWAKSSAASAAHRRGSRSMSSVVNPSWPSQDAALQPAGPPPMMATSMEVGLGMLRPGQSRELSQPGLILAHPTVDPPPQQRGKDHAVDGRLGEVVLAGAHPDEV